MNSPETRQHDRHKVRGGAFAVLSALGEYALRFGQVEDISRGGAAFSYTGERFQCGVAAELDLFSHEMPDVFIRRIPCRIVYQVPDHVSQLKALGMTRCGLQFEELTGAQITRLLWFIYGDLERLVFHKEESEETILRPPS